MVAVCILGAYVRDDQSATTSLSIAWMLALVASLVALTAAVNVFQVCLAVCASRFSFAFFASDSFSREDLYASRVSVTFTLPK